MWYKINFLDLLQQFLMTGLRRRMSLSLMSAVFRPLITLHYAWRQHRSSDIYKIDHSGQVCSLRGVLNDRFDPEERRIEINGFVGVSRNYIYTKPENKPQNLGTFYLRNNLEFEDTGADFKVYVPHGIINSQGYEVRSVIDYYKAGGKRYIIPFILTIIDDDQILS